MKQPNPERTPILLGQIDTDNHIATTVSLFVILLVVHRIGISVYRLYFHPLRKFPGPRYLAATELPYLYRNHLKGDWVRDMVGLHRKYGPVVRIAPNRLALDGSIGWPQVFAHRGANQDEYAKVRGFLFPGDHEAIIAAPRDVHRRQRRQLAHAFSDGALIEHEPLICHYVSLLVQQLAKRAENNELIDIVKWLNFTTFDIIGDLTFGESFHSLDNSEYHPWVLTIFETIKGSAMGRFFAAYPIVRPLVVLSMGADRIKKLQEHQIFSKEKARARMAAGAEPGRRDFMTYMLRDTRSGEKGLTTNEIEMNSPILITAGSETTATALSGFFFYLVQTPSAYDYLTKEIRSAFRNEDEINLRSTSSLQYLQGCIEETLRCYPPSAETPPRVSPGGEIDGRYVSSGTILSVYQWSTFRNPQNFRDPDSFRPERWLPTSHPLHDVRFDNDNRSAFKPFSAGTRDCIGKKLAYSEMRLIISRILFRFDYEIAESQDDWHTSQLVFVIWDKGPLKIKLKPRTMTE